MAPQQPTLDGRQVRLEPLSLDHVPGLCAIGLEPAIWKYMRPHVLTPDDMREYVKVALAQRDADSSIPFATIDKATNTVVGSTRYCAIDLDHRRTEIGWTWIGPAWQRTHVNTEVKYLMLSHAFEVMKCMRVELKTDSENAKSRAAILRLGAVEEGTFRKHMVMPGGRIRHSVYFSILDDEWPAVKARLIERMARDPGTAEP